MFHQTISAIRHNFGGQCQRVHTFSHVCPTGRLSLQTPTGRPGGKNVISLAVLPYITILWNIMPPCHLAS